MDFKLEAKKYEKQFKEDLKEIVSIASLRDDSTKSEKAPFGKACRAALDKMMEIGQKAGFHVKDIDGYMEIRMNLLVFWHIWISYQSVMAGHVILWAAKK